MLAVNFKNGIVLLDARICCGGAFNRRDAHDDTVARVNADIANTHCNFGTGRILRRYYKFFGNYGKRERCATAMNRQGDACSEAHTNLLAEIVPALRRLAVHGGDGIARLYARGERRRILRDKAHDELVCRGFLHAHHVEHHQ